MSSTEESRNQQEHQPVAYIYTDVALLHMFLYPKDVEIIETEAKTQDPNVSTEERELLHKQAEAAKVINLDFEKREAAVGEVVANYVYSKYPNIKKYLQDGLVILRKSEETRSAEEGTFLEIFKTTLLKKTNQYVREYGYPRDSHLPGMARRATSEGLQEGWHTNPVAPPNTKS